jgi:predicted alpha-1,2-mannosidase
MTWFRAPLLFALVVGACVSSGCTTESTEDAPPGRVTVDAEDRFCDPVDEMEDDEASPEAPPAKPLTQWVNPFIGTGGVAWGTGSAYPGAQVPFGMAKPGPDTSRVRSSMEFSHCAGYSYADDTIEGFSHTRLHGAGIADYGGIALMPATAFEPAKARPRSHGSRFTHANEKAAPGYYAVTLEDSRILAELTATARVAVHRYTFPEGAGRVVYLDAGHLLADGTEMRDAEITIDPASREAFGFSWVDGSYSARGGGIRIFFVVRFEDAFAEWGTYLGGAAGTAPSVHGADAGAYVRFDGATVIAHVGLSYVDVEHARQNLGAESAPFDDTRSAAEAAWEQRLSALTIHARSDRDRRIAYTALYHTGMMPTLASDVDGAYRGIDGEVHRAEGFRYFTDFSLWDTYRTFHPLIALLYPNDARDFAVSLTRMGQEGGVVPRWPVGTVESEGMIGDGGAIVLADTWVRGVRDWDARAAYAILKQQATTPKTPGRRGGREGIADYVTLGWVPKDDEGASAAARSPSA